MIISKAPAVDAGDKKRHPYGHFACLVLLIFILSALIAPASAVLEIIPAESYADTQSHLTAADVEYYLSNANTSITLFYSSTCGACHKAMPYIDEARAKYPNVRFYSFDNMGSPSNLSLMNRFAERYGVSYPSYPVIFAGDTVVLQGFNRISNNIDSVAKAVDAGLIPDAGYEKRLFSSANGSGTIGMQDLTFPAVILAGLLDGINPCAFAVLIFLLIALTAAESKRRVLQIGLTYTLGVFLIYITAGIGIIKIVSLTGLSFYFTFIAGILVIAAGIIEVADGVLKNSPVSLSIPESKKEFFAGYIRRATVPAAFVLGVLVGIFELPCTGGIYLAVLSLLSSQLTFNEGLIYLVIYNLAFILPLILIVLAVTLGISPEMINRFREEHKKTLRAAIGILLIAMGIFVIVLSYI